MTTITYSVTALTSPTSINATTTGNQLNGDLVTLGNGDSVAIYADSSTATLYAREIGPSGAAIGAEVQVATGIDASFARFANAAVLSNGDVVVTWADNVATQQVHYRLYDQNLNPLTAIQNVTSPEAGGTSHPDVAALAGGGFVIAFQDDVSPGASDIYAQRYTAGGALNGSVIAVSATPGGSNRNPTVAGLVDGGFAIAHDVLGGAQMFRSIWNADGSLRLTDGVFDPVGTQNFDADAVALPSGGFVVNYIDNQRAGNVDISSVGFAATGSPGSPFSRLTNNPNADIEPKSAVSADGYIFVSSTDVGTTDDTYGALVDLTGQVVVLGGALDTGAGNHFYGTPVWTDRSHIAFTETTDGTGGDGSGTGIASSIYHVVRTTTVTVAGQTIGFATDGIDNLVFLNGNNETFSAGGGNDTIHGIGNSDTLVGGSGDDLYFVGAASDVVVENLGGGTDTVQTALAAYTLTANVEDLVGTSTTGQYLVGNDLANAITAGPGNDTIDGGAGADFMAGGAGDDTYVVDNPGDEVSENPGGGTDSVITSLASYILPANVERLYGTINTGEYFVGNASDDTIVAGNGPNQIFAGTGSLYVAGGNGGSQISAAGNDANNLLYGGSGNDTIVGGNGNDTIVGYGGVDTLYGGPGNDYVVAGPGPGSGLDGGSGDDSLWGGSGNDTIIGDDGSDLIVGEGGSDALYGGAGNDSLYGGTGTDYIYGGPGNDLIWTDDAGSPQSTDYIYEGGGTGVDTVADFTPGDVANRDVLVIAAAATGISSFAQIQAHTTQVGVYSVISLGGGDQVYLYNVQPFQLTADDFIFE